MGILSPKPGKDDAFLVRLFARFGCRQVQQLGAVGNVDAAVTGLQPGWNNQAVGKNGDFIGFADALGVFEHDDLVVRLFARLDLRIGLTADDPEPAAGVKVHLNRLGQQRVRGKEIDFESLRQDERLAFQLGVRVGHLGVALGKGGCRGQQKIDAGDVFSREFPASTDRASEVAWCALR